MIYGFTGKARSGKTTACNHLKSIGNYKQLNFKDCLIEEMREKLPDILHHLSDIYGKTIDELFFEKPPAMRALMQNFGTDVRRADDPGYWVQQWVNRASALIEEGHNILVDDVRFINESDAIRLMGGSIIRIVRTDVDETLSHVSETEMDSIDVDAEIAVDTGDLSTLYNVLDAIIENERK